MRQGVSLVSPAVRGTSRRRSAPLFFDQQQICFAKQGQLAEGRAPVPNASRSQREAVTKRAPRARKSKTGQFLERTGPCHLPMVGVAGFELATPCTPCKIDCPFRLGRADGVLRNLVANHSLSEHRQALGFAWVHLQPAANGNRTATKSGAIAPTPAEGALWHRSPTRACKPARASRTPG